MRSVFCPPVPAVGPGSHGNGSGAKISAGSHSKSAPETTSRVSPDAIGITKPYKFIGLGAIDITKTYKFVGLGAIGITKPYKFIRFGPPPRKSQLSLLFLPMAWGSPVPPVAAVGSGAHPASGQVSRAGFGSIWAQLTFAFQVYIILGLCRFAPDQENKEK